MRTFALTGLMGDNGSHISPLKRCRYYSTDPPRPSVNSSSAFGGLSAPSRRRIVNTFSRLGARSLFSHCMRIPSSTERAAHQAGRHGREASFMVPRYKINSMGSDPGPCAILSAMSGCLVDILNP